jgi:hypothetical protein
MFRTVTKRRPPGAGGRAGTNRSRGVEVPWIALEPDSEPVHLWSAGNAEGFAGHSPRLTHGDRTPHFSEVQ